MKEIASRSSKRKAEASPFAGKKLRSTTTRLSRKRAQISPSPLQPKQTGAPPAASVDSCSNLFSAVDDTVSCGSSVVVVENSSKLKKTRIEEVEVSDRVKETTIADPKFRRITRSYSKLNKEKETETEVIEVSESSVTRSDVTFADHVSYSRSLNIVSENKESDVVSENKESDVVSFISGVDSCSKFGSVTGGGGGGGDNEETEISKPSGFAELKPELVTVGCVSDLACAETFSGEEVSEYDEDESSEPRSQTLSQYSDFDFSDYTPSMFFDSGSEFSEKSNFGSPVSHTRSLYLQFMAQFCRSTVPNDLESSRCEQRRDIQSELLRFEDEEVEESYQRLRERERSHAYLRDCAKAYCSTMDHTDLIPRLRLIMVQWIVQQCSELELQPETLFLGVSLLDRFLSKGSFNSQRTLVLVGIASLTLATRIEENQPYNSIRKRNFYIQNLKYSRHEVVAMEWLVQEVLNFKCFSPTIFNFLWFYLKAARANPEVERKAKSLAVTSLSDHTQLCFWPSTVAAGLVVLACIEHSKISAYQRVIKVHVRTEDNDLPECVKSLEWLLEQ
ncbi:Cyclin-SDS [Raphanus sativus]|uniref:Cyclin-SDS n=1 Tax=Raphanus sativus TaxID=3726 RepID=A0A6J0MCP9_RAPSA|nr:cyclin-SDS [Raphanus sativus]KAJ4915805.1 Cyclin-SDS [Raphanus sativus]